MYKVCGTATIREVLYNACAKTQNHWSLWCQKRNSSDHYLLSYWNPSTILGQVLQHSTSTNFPVFPPTSLQDELNLVTWLRMVKLTQSNNLLDFHFLKSKNISNYYKISEKNLTTSSEFMCSDCVISKISTFYFLLRIFNPVEHIYIVPPRHSSMCGTNLVPDQRSQLI